MTDRDRHGLMERDMLTAAEVAEVCALRDYCNAYEGLDLKLTLSASSDGSLEHVSAFLYYSDGVLVGYCALDGVGSEEVELCGMVRPELRRRGIGRSLLAAATATAKRQGAARLLIICEAASRSGQGFAATTGAPYRFAEHHMELERLRAKPPTEPHLALAPAGAEDIAVLARIIARAFGSAEDGTRERIAQDIQSASERYSLARLASEPVGALKVSYAGDRAGIYAFGVLPEYRGRGVGRQMLTAIIETLQAEGYTRIGLEVESENAPALALYRSCGFRETTTYQYFALDLTDAPAQV